MRELTRRGLAGFALAAAPGLAGATEIAALDVTQNPFGPSAAARAALARAVEHVEVYPYAADRALAETIAAANGLSADHVAISTGGLEPLAMVTAFWTRGGVQLAPVLTYDTHIGYGRRVGASARRVPMAAGQQIDLAALAAGAAAEDVKLVYLCNPNNPTGLLADRAALRSACRAAAKRAPVIVDEAFIDMSADPAAESVADLVREGHDVVVVGTFSKSYGLAAVRIGYCLARPERARAIRALLAPSRNGPGLAAARASYRDMAYLAASNRAIGAGREAIYRACNAAGRPFLSSAGSYVWIDFGGAEGISRVEAQGVRLRRFDGAPEGWARAAVAEAPALAAFATAMKKAFA